MLARVEREDISRRIRAARALAVPTDEELAARSKPLTGITIEELAARIDMDGLAAKTLGNLERGAGPAVRPQLREIAEACGLPYEFFTVDLATLGPPVETTLEQRLQDLEDTQRIMQETLAMLTVDPESIVPSDAPAESSRRRRPRTRTA